MAVKRKPRVKWNKVRQVQIEPGKRYRLRSPLMVECCECGLTHVEEYELHDGMIFNRTRVDRRATRAARKRDGIIITRQRK